MPQGARITDIAGNTTTIVFRSLETNLPLTGISFELKIPAGTDIDDRRPARNESGEEEISAGGE